MSALGYFGCVLGLTALGIGVAMQLRPGFAHSVRALAGLEKPVLAKPDSFYTVRVAPLFDARCNSCHGEQVSKAQLRLDSFDASLRGGRHGAVIVPGDARTSNLFTRITLPESDDRAMPPSGKPPLTRDEVTVIRLWIAAGASGDMPVRAIRNAPRPVVEVKFPETDPAAVHKARAALAAAVPRLQARFANMIAYESRASADLVVNASLRGASFGDAELQALSPLKARIVAADFSATAVTDASAPSLAAMTSLRSLRLMDTKVGDATVQALAALTSLRSLTVTGTLATEAGLAPLRRRGVVIYGGRDVP